MAIDVRNIVKKFGDFTAVKGITFEVAAGEIFGLLGPNGAGKSTLIRMLTTLLPPSEGTALIRGFDVAKQADGVRQSIGVIPQAMTSDLELSVEENLLIYAKLYGVPREKRTRLIDELLEAVELTQWRDKQVRQSLGRHAPPRRNRARPRPRAADLLSRRTDHRPRPGVARARVGNAAADQGRARSDGADHHALHGRGRQAVRPDCHRRPRRAEGARFADEAQSLGARQEHARSRASPRTPADWADTLRRAARSGGCDEPRPCLPARDRATVRPRRWP